MTPITLGDESSEHTESPDGSTAASLFDCGPTMLSDPDEEMRSFSLPRSERSGLAWSNRVIRDAWVSVLR